MLYRLALETGSRWSELNSLMWASFDLEGEPAPRNGKGWLLKASA